MMCAPRQLTRSTSCGLAPRWESLERRALLATFVGTPEADLIVFDLVGGVPTVTINGVSTTVTDNVIQLDGGAGDDQINVRNPGSRAFTLLGGAGEDELNAFAGSPGILMDGGEDFDTHILQEGTATIRGSDGVDDVTLNPDAVGSANVIVSQVESWGNVSIQTGGAVTLAANGVSGLVVDAVGLLRGTIDLANRFMVVRFPPDISLVDNLRQGYAGGSWSGVPTQTVGVLTSSVARGSAVGDALGYGVVGPAAGQLDLSQIEGVPLFGDEFVIRHTLQGDTNFDRQVTFNDLLTLARSYGSVATSWPLGDFDYDLDTDFNDLLRLAKNYGASAWTTWQALTFDRGEGMTIRRPGVIV